MAKNDIEKDVEKARVAVASLMANMDLHLATMFAKAKMCRAYYLALIKEEFTKSEALELCKSFKIGEL